jgi:hypothetical protein
VFVRDDSVLLTSCTSLDIYDVPTGQLRRSYTGPTTNEAISVAVNPQRDALASVCQGKVNVWRLDGLAPGATRSFPLPPDPVRNIFRISVGEGNTRLLLWGAKSVYLYDLTAVNPAPQAVVFSGRGDLEQVNFVDNGRFIVTLHVDHTNISHWCNYGIRRRYAHTAH